MGQRERFERLVRPVLGRLHGFARRLTRDPVAAEDLLQRALVRGLERFSQLQDDGAFVVWQSRVLYTTFLNERPRRQGMEVEEDAVDRGVIPFERPGPEQEVMRAQIGVRIGDALDRLPREQREAIWLVDGQGLKFAEAAEVLGVPPGTVASRVGRARVALRSMLAQVAADAGVTR